MGLSTDVLARCMIGSYTQIIILLLIITTLTIIITIVSLVIAIEIVIVPLLYNIQQY